MDVDEVDNTTHAPAACNLSAPALCAPTMGYYGGDVWRYPAAGNGSYYFMLPQRLWHWEGAAQGWHEPVSTATISLPSSGLHSSLKMPTVSAVADRICPARPR